VSRDKERYRFLEEEYQLVAREQLVSGCHVHVGIADRDLAVATLARTARWLAPLVALAANSPFWMGVDTGYSSYRTEVWSRWPMTGMPDPLESTADYDRLVDALVATGVIRDASFIYWDVRPSSRYPTLEFRVTDACTRIDEVVMVAGLCRALARTCSAEAASGTAAAPTRRELLVAAKWRAARHGLDDALVDPVGGRLRPAAEVVATLLDHLRPALEDCGDWDEVAELVGRVLREGNGAQRQRAVAARHGDLSSVVELLLAETEATSG
jgi:carboxylate-amine ligase